MARRIDTGAEPTPGQIRAAERVQAMSAVEQRVHPSAVPSDPSKLDHINTYGALPEYYIDRPFICRVCGAPQVWKARDQKWYYEEAKGHIDAYAVECRPCRSKPGGPPRRYR